MKNIYAKRWNCYPTRPWYSSWHPCSCVTMVKEKCRDCNEYFQLLFILFFLIWHPRASISYDESKILKQRRGIIFCVTSEIKILAPYIIIDVNRSEGISAIASERDVWVDACDMRETHADHTHRRFLVRYKSACWSSWRLSLIVVVVVAIDENFMVLSRRLDPHAGPPI